jgi:Na+/H+-dicarboxylate symporter
MNLPTKKFTVKDFVTTINKPLFTLGFVVLAILIGFSGSPAVEYLRPVGDLYLALLQMLVLPFLITTIPLAIRSAMTAGNVRDVLTKLIIWTVVATVVCSVISLIVGTQLFNFIKLDQSELTLIGDFLGVSNVDKADIVVFIDGFKEAVNQGPSGILSLIPQNVFQDLAANDSNKILVFFAIFGIALVMSERKNEHSLFGSIRHVQRVCLVIFEWFNIIMPIGIIALIAPQVAKLSPQIYVMLSLFVVAYVIATLLIVAVSIFGISYSLKKSLRESLQAMSATLTMGAVSRNALIAIPSTVEGLVVQLKANKSTVDLFIPLGYTTFRFGLMVYFIIATLFFASLLNVSFNIFELVSICLFCILASISSLGLNGVAVLPTFAIVLKAFGLPYELALPLLAIIDPISQMIRPVMNISVNCAIAVLAGGPEDEVVVSDQSNVKLVNS